jgi:hypothetical protein
MGNLGMCRVLKSDNRRVDKCGAMRSVLAGLSALLLTCFAQAAEIADNKHLGVVTCASSTCHGKTGPQKDKHVALNEYRTWLQDDLHAQAYKILESAASKAIAAKLGLANAATAKICLDCHTDNVPADKRGPKFQLSDGIGCEACHGGAERWIESHAATNATHKANLAAGMYPTESPMDRARLCLSCHVGTRDRLATHAMMGAGHPRLSFELEAFTANQPAHYVVDADYVERKGKIEGVNLWLTGQFESARRLLTLQQSDIAHPPGMFPELAFYDCHSCHHPMNTPRWTRTRAGTGIAPGSLRLQTHNLVTIQAVAEAMGASDANQLAAARVALIRAGQTDANAVKAAAKQLSDWLAAHDAWTRRTFARADTLKIRKTLIDFAAADRASDFAAAEQIVLGAESLSYALGDRDKLKSALDVLYRAVKSDSEFDPGKFAVAAKSVQKQF